MNPPKNEENGDGIDLDLLKYLVQIMCRIILVKVG
jgi:hypothetical protein